MILAVELAGVLALGLGVIGLGGIIFTALRFNRDDTTAIVTQQDLILRDMKSLNEELRITANGLREERDALAVQVEKLRIEIEEFHGGKS
jgi:hypothetical protein